MDLQAGAYRRGLPVRQGVQRLIRRLLWGMDIHPSARIATSALIDRTYPRGVHIAADVTIGEEAVLLTHDMARGLYCDTRIGRGTCIGARAIIMPGVSVGEDCMILPGALVHRDVPAGHAASGNPMTLEARGEPQCD